MPPTAVKTVFRLTSASAAIASMVVAANPWLAKSRPAAATIWRRVRRACESRTALTYVLLPSSVIQGYSKCHQYSA